MELSLSRFDARLRKVFVHPQVFVIPENAIVCEGKAAAVNMTKERMIVLIELSIALGRHSRVTHDYVDVMRKVDLHFPSGQRALINPHTTVEIIRNAGCIRATNLTLTR